MPDTTQPTAPDSELRRELDGIFALYMTTAGLAPQGFEKILALVHRLKRNAVTDYMDKLTEKDGRLMFTRAELEALDELYPPP